MTTSEKTREQEFIERVESFGAGELAMLRRGCGKRDPVEGRCPWLHAHIYGVSSEPVAFLIASLLAQYKTTDIRSGRHKAAGNFGSTWKRAIAGIDSKSIKRRFHILLDAEYDPRTGDGDLPHRLRQMMRYVATKDEGVDWPELLKHLRSWNSSEKWVQKKWARSFFEMERPENPESIEISQEKKE